MEDYNKIGVEEYVERGVIENMLPHIQHFFQKKSTTYDGFYFHELEAYLLTVEEKLLNENVLEKADEKKYNAIWDTLIYIREKANVFPKGDYLIAAHWSVKKIFEQMYVSRGGVMLNKKES